MPYGSSDLIRMFLSIAARLDEERDHLCRLDGEIGDADHGIAMSQGFGAVRKAMSEIDADKASPSEVFNTAAKAFLNAVGASSGPLYATAFMRAGAAVKDKSELSDDDVSDAFQAMARGIEDRGKAAVGEKTMIDAWAPAASALADARKAEESLSSALQAACRAASAGAEATRNMVAAKGRSSRLGERAIGHVDPGAVSAAIIIEVIVSSLGEGPVA